MKSLLTSCVAVALSFHLTLACTPLLASHQNTARDSAGIRIVYSAEPAIPSPETWFVDPTAEVSIGQTEGPEEYVFPSVTAGTILSDGTIVTAVSARGRTIGIRYFDESGRFLGQVSGDGDGPGELRSLYELFWVPGDSVMGVGADFRYAIFDRQQKLAHTGRIEPPFPGMVFGLVDLGLIAADVSVWTSPEQEMQTGLHASEKVFLIVHIDAGVVDSVATLHGSMTFREGRAIYPVPFDRDAYATAGNGQLWIGRSDIDEVRGYSSSGILTTIIRGIWPSVEVTGDHKRMWKEQRLLGLNGDRRRNEERWHRRLSLPDRWRVGFPDSMPRFQRLVVDRTGNLWVSRYDPMWSKEDLQWRVYDPKGVWLTTVTVPLEILGHCTHPRSNYGCLVSILEIGSDYLLVAHQDELGVPRVRKHRLVKHGYQ